MSINFKLIKRKNSKSWYVQHFNGTYTSYWSCRTSDKALAKKRRDFYMGEVLRPVNCPEGGDRPEDISIAAALSVYMGRPRPGRTLARDRRLDTSPSCRVLG